MKKYLTLIISLLLISSSALAFTNLFDKIGVGSSTPRQLIGVQGNGLFSGDLFVANFFATGTTQLNGITYTWPASAVNGNCLQTTGAGVLSWATCGSGGGGTGGGWTFGTGFIYNATTTDQVLIGATATTSAQKLDVEGGGFFNGSLGIGTTSPSNPLSVQGNGLISGNLNVANLTATGTLNVASNATFTSSVALNNGASVAAGGLAMTTGGNGINANGNYIYWPTGASSAGIGLLNLSNNYTFFASAVNQAMAIGSISGGAGGNNPAMPGGTLDVIGTSTASTARALNVMDSNKSSLFFIQDNGNVGIATTSPASPFSVQGNGLISGNLSVAGLTATGTISFPTGSISNATLANSSVTVNANSPLGGGGSPTLGGAGITLTCTNCLNVGNATNHSGLVNLGITNSGSTYTFTTDASSTPSFGQIFATSTATSTFQGGIQILGTGNVCLPNGTCIGGAGGTGLTSLNGLSGATQTFSANGPLAITSGGTVHTFNASSSPFFGTVFASSTLTVGSPIGAGLGNFEMGRDAASELLVIHSHGNAVTPGINTYASQGTQASPTASLKDDQLYFMGARGYGTTDYDVGSKAAIQFKASQTHTDTKNGTYITFETTANDSTTRLEQMRLDQLGRLGVGTTTPQWLFEIASNTPSLALTDDAGGTNLKHWLFSSMGGNLYVGTSSDAYATGTIPALTILNNGNVGLASSSPGSLFSIGGVANFTTATSTLYGNGIDLTNGCFSIRGTCITGGGGSGITSLNGLSGSSQTFSTNGPLAILSAGTVHTFNASSSPYFGALTATSTAHINTLLLDNALTVANGGTGAATFSAGDLLVGQGTSAFTSTSTLTVSKGGTGAGTFTAGSVLIANGTGAFTASSSLGVNIAPGSGGGSGITSLNGLNGASQTFSANGPLAILSAGTVHAFNASSSPYFGSLTATSTLNINGGLVQYNQSSTSSVPNLTINAWSVATSTTATPILSVNSISGGDYLQVGTPAFFYLSNNSRVGIGTSTPGSALSVNGSVNFTTATSSLYGTGGIDLLAGCFSVRGVCVSGSGAGGITSLNGLTGATQTFSANGPLAILSAGTVHAFNASSSPYFGTLTASSTAHINTLTLDNALTVANGGTASTTFGGLLSGNGSSLNSATVSSPLGWNQNTQTLTCANCISTEVANGDLAIVTSGNTATFNASSSPYFGTVTASSTVHANSLTLDNTLTLANGGTNATSFTTSGNGVYYDGTRLLTAPLASSITIPYASTTAITVTNASTTALTVSSLNTSGCTLKTNTDGTVICGTDLQGNGTFSFTPAVNFATNVNSTTTPISFTNGLMASTTSYFVNTKIYGNATFPSLLSGVGVFDANGLFSASTTLGINVAPGSGGGSANATLTDSIPFDTCTAQVDSTTFNPGGAFDDFAGNRSVINMLAGISSRIYCTVHIPNSYSSGGKIIWSMTATTSGNLVVDVYATTTNPNYSPGFAGPVACQYGVGSNILLNASSTAGSRLNVIGSTNYPVTSTTTTVTNTLAGEGELCAIFERSGLNASDSLKNSAFLLYKPEFEFVRKVN